MQYAKPPDFCGDPCHIQAIEAHIRTDPPDSRSFAVKSCCPSEAQDQDTLGDLLPFILTCVTASSSYKALHRQRHHPIFIRLGHPIRNYGQRPRRSN